MSGLRIEEFHGTSHELHSIEAPVDGPRRVWHLIPSGPAVVLGSTQDVGDVDPDAAGRAGVEIVKRRSGGGAVWVDAADPVWIDIWIPRDDPVWTDDVGRSFLPIGEAWVTALEALGVTGTAPHRGAMLCHPGSRQVCFAGVGPGEILAGERKLVGVSQRRTRAGARFQCALYRRWDPAPLHRVLVAPPPLSVLRARAVGLDEVATSPIEPSDVVSALGAALA